MAAERLTAEPLNALARAQGLASGPARVLFVCSQNTGRSQMAAALLAHRADPDGAPIAAVRDIRDAIDAPCAELLTQLAP
ncbi:arsenate reductase/protein-tyrosine-phosphatase family protein [Streptomyces sp. CB00455]|uniref:arsenate reductase/protein-tyrosine-phosphatase family protein n=1 Tax=Streptomyces sp. CB00455 TaxID=1703927 RepID=UPI00093D77A8|nr:hypothetical protein [Streptomyces sp. CB00455]